MNRRDRLIAAYVEWAAACHDSLTRARDLGVAISNEKRIDPGVDYPVAALFYLNREPRSIYWREYVEFRARLEVSQFKVGALGDDYEGYQFPEIVADISRLALKIEVRQGAPDVRGVLNVFVYSLRWRCRAASARVARRRCFSC
jgi:hypothetical protein